jgi:hypothetical protein
MRISAYTMYRIKLILLTVTGLIHARTKNGFLFSAPYREFSRRNRYLKVFFHHSEVVYSSLFCTQIDMLLDRLQSLLSHACIAVQCCMSGVSFQWERPIFRDLPTKNLLTDLSCVDAC